MVMNEEIIRLWRAHQEEGLPDVPPEAKGELWVLDEVIGGCIAHYLASGETLDSSRLNVLEDCRADLKRLLPGLEGGATTYFSRLGSLADLILADVTGRAS